MKPMRWLVGCLLVGGVVALAPRGVCDGEKTGKIGKGSEVAAVAPAPVAGLDGTTWEGVDSDGDFYAVTFLPGGRIRYTTNTSGSTQTHEKPGDFWAQNGPVVILVMNNYATRLGHVSGTQMTGDAWNVAGRRWTWKLARK